MNMKPVIEKIAAFVIFCVLPPVVWGVIFSLCIDPALGMIIAIVLFCLGIDVLFNNKHVKYKSSRSSR